jgi:DNA modification methylase
MDINRIYEGDALEVLQTFPEKSIDCCITSPPYWALRDYGTQPLIRGGDSFCEHEFISNGKNITHPSDTILGDRRSVNAEVESKSITWFRINTTTLCKSFM